MEYAKKLKIAKILVTLGIAIFTLTPFFTHLDVNIWGNIIAFPVFLYVLWGSLHGTGRSVRLVAFLGMAYAIGSFISANTTGANWKQSESQFLGLIFVILALGVFISLKPRNS